MIFENGIHVIMVHILHCKFAYLLSFLHCIFRSVNGKIIVCSTFLVFQLHFWQLSKSLSVAKLHVTNGTCKLGHKTMLSVIINE